jgi:tetratricopeptide (TPR) repeat protein
MKKLILISLIIGVSNFKILYSQNIDSLKNEFRNDSELNDESFKRTLSIAKYYLTRNIDSFETYRIDCYMKAKKVGNVKYEAKSIAFRGHYFTNIGKEKNALDEFKSAYNLIKDTEDKKDIIALLGNIGNSFSHINIDSTIYYYNSAGKMAKSIGDLDQYYKVKFNTSRMLSNSGKKEDALKGYIECLAFFEKNASSNKKQIAYTLGNIGTIYSDLRDHKTAINYFKRAIKLNEELQDKMMMNSNYLNLAYSYKDISNIAMARNYINKVDTNRIYLPNSKKSLKFIIMATILEKEKRYVEALELVSQVENIPDDVPLNVHNIAAVKGRLLIKMKEYEKAKPYIDKAILSAKIHSNAIGLSHDLILSAEIKAKLGDYESAYNELRNQFYGSDSIFSKERLNSMKELETKYQTEKKKQKINT